ncbi:hypothetical protein HK405_000371 [Cladochytrium tenue]|nr:hypothetical protein HK405_000371 [Cladochytrium tenue]
MAPRPRFVLNVATAGMEAQLLAIGAGRRGIWAAASAAAADNNAASAAVDAGAETHVSEIHQPKLDALGLRACAPGRPGTPAELPAADGQLHAVFGLEGDGFCAHAVCVVDLVVERHGHLVLLCEVEEAWARREYWDGRCLAPKRMRRRKRRAGGGDEEGEVEGEHGNNGEEGRELPGLLAFMGSKRFAVMEPMVDGDEEGADPDTTG